jgi:RND superfamily putative drug exporter
MAAWCTNRARGVAFGWCIALLIVLVAGFLAGGQRSRSNFRLPGADSQTASDLIQADFPHQRGDAEAIVISSPTGLTSGAGHANAEALFAKLRTLPGVTSVTDPLNGAPNAGLALNHRTAIAVLRFQQGSLSVPADETTDLVKTVTSSRTTGFDAAVMGWAVEDAASNSPAFAEMVGIIAATIVLLFAFGSVVAVAVAMGSALVSLGLSYGLIELASHVVQIPYFEPQIALTIGLGIGIDYSLLMIARYRGARQRSPAGSRDVIDAMSRTGRTVAFAGCTVVLAMLGLLVTPVTLMRDMTAGVVIAVVPTVLAANSLLPALLHLFDRHLNRMRPPFMHDKKLVERSETWARWSAAVQRRPVAALLASLMVLGILATPIFWLRLGPGDGSTDNPHSNTAQAYTMASNAFGPGVTSEFDVVASFPTKVHAVDASVGKVRNALLRTPDVMYVGPAIFGTGSRQALFQVIPGSAPEALTTAQLLSTLRGRVANQLAHDRIDLAVGGSAAMQADLAARILAAFPLTLLAVIGGSFLLLLLQFRSIVIALKAGAMNLLSISAAFGVVVAIFQWGWGRQLIGIDHAGPIQSFVPLLLFPALFGLSMDYEVFLMSRMTDEWERTRDSRVSVTEGLATTGRVITSGAAIMFALFAAMALSGDRTVEMFGIGLATAVLIDATVIRSVLLPAAMQLLGRLNWWMPSWLQRRLPAMVRHA